jgi:hypothetical protein
MNSEVFSKSNLMIAGDKSTEMVEKTITRITKELPERTAIVRCNGFRCLAVSDKVGVWRDGNGHALNVVEVVEEI